MKTGPSTRSKQPHKQQCSRRTCRQCDAGLALAAEWASTDTATNLSNAGKIIVGSGSGLSVGGSYTQTGGITTVDGQLTAPLGLVLQKGSLLGKGKLGGAVTSRASVTAGDSATKPGTLAVTGSYTQSSTGTLNISLGGMTAGMYGQVTVSNGVSLRGTLSIKLVNGYVPVVGDTFSIVTGSAVTGQFATVKGLRINSSEHFAVDYSATAVTLTVVLELRSRGRKLFLEIRHRPIPRELPVSSAFFPLKNTSTSRYLATRCSAYFINTGS